MLSLNSPRARRRTIRRGLQVLAAAILLLPATLVTATAVAALPSGFSERTVITGLDHPEAVQFAPDGRVFIAEKSGIIKVFDDLNDTTPTIFADLRTNVHNYWDRGMSSIKLDPQFPARPYVYVVYTYDAPPGGTAPRWGTAGATTDTCPSPPGGTADGCVVTGRVSRLTASGNVMTGSELVLVQDWCQQFPSHTVDDLAFGADGALYVSAGEGAAFFTEDWGQLGGTQGVPNPPTVANPCGDPPDGVGHALSPPTSQGGSLRAQDIRTSGDPVGLSGSVIRINPDTGLGMPDNPMAGSVDLNARRIIAYGLRNPYRLTIRPGTNDVYVGDVGDSRWEEINRIPTLPTPTAGPTNFGWPCYEGTPRQPNWDFHDVDLCESLYTQGTATSPYFSYPHTDDPVAPGDTCRAGAQASLSGLAFSTSTRYPARYAGALFMADYTRDCIWVMRAGAGGAPDPSLIEPFIADAANPTDLEIGPNGDLFYVDYDGGTLRRIEYTSANSAPTAAATATPAGGPVPLTVQFDGTGSSDPDGDTLTYSWDLDGDGVFGDATSSKPSHSYSTAGSVTVSLLVRDPGGLQDTATVVVTPGNSPPRPTIDSPASTLTWGVGDRISFSGHADDPDSGAIAASSLSWSLLIHHCATPTTCHLHAVEDFTGVADGSFTAPDHEYPSYLELRLTATDPKGLSATTSVILAADALDVTLQSVPTGLTLSAGSTVGPTPLTDTVIRNATTTLTAPAQQTLNGRTYAFVSWSDGAAATHAIHPTAPTTVTATYQEITGTTYAADTFTRSQTNTWGTATTGGAWGLLGPAADYNVTGQAGTIALTAASSNRPAVLGSVSARDVDLGFRIATSKVAAGGNEYIYGLARYQGSTNHYRLKIRIATNGQVFVHASAVVNNVETAIGNEVLVPGLSHAAGSFIRLRAQVQGTSPTTIRVRAWADGSAEPSTWQYTATDSTATLQAAGGVGLQAYLSSTATNAPVVATFDDFLVTSIGSAAANQPPVVDTATITPSSPTTGQTLTANVTSHDPEGSPLTTSYQWTRNGTNIAAATGQTLNLATAGNGDRGDAIRVVVTVSDGSLTSAPVTASPVTVANSAPTATVALGPSGPDTNASLTATATKADADGDSVSLTYVWKVNGTTRKTTTNSAGLTDTFDLSVAGNGDAGDTVSVEVTPSDGTATGTLASAQVTVASSLVTYAADTFTRSQTNTWGTATTGGAWSFTPTGNIADFDVNGSAGTMTLTAAGVNRLASLNTVSATSVDISFRIAADKAAAGGNQYFYGVVRRVGTTNEYRAKLRFATNGQVFVQATQVVNNVETAIGSEVLVAGLTRSAGQFIRLRAQFEGTSPTTIRMRAWADGTSEPSTWQYTATDSTAALQAAGGVGLRSYLASSTTNTPVVATFDDFLVTSIGSAAANQPPVVDTATITPSSPTTGQTLTANVTSHDPEGSSLTTSYQWTRNGTNIAAATGQTLNLATAGNGDRGDAIRVVVTVSDGSLTSAPVTASPVTVANSAPTATVALGPSGPDTNASLTATATKADADGDSVSLTYVWKVNGTTRKTTTNSAGLTDTFDLSVAGNGDAGDTVSVEVTPSDGTATGTLASAQVTVASSLVTYAADTFTRSQTNTWGTATTGGAWGLLGPAADYNVTGQAGTIALTAASSNRPAVLGSVSARDVDLGFRIATSKVAAGGNEYIYGLARYQGSTNHYRLKIRIATNGQVFVHASAVVNNVETAIGNEVLVPGLSHAAGSFIRLRAQVQGTSPTTIRVRAWADGSAEPSTWQYTATDSTATLQAAGGVGLQAYLSSTATNAPVVATFDDFLVTSIGS